MTDEETREAGDPRGAFERIDRALAAWRPRVDDLLVQLDLASMNARSEVRERADVAVRRVEAVLADLEHACSAALEALGHRADDGRG